MLKRPAICARSYFASMDTPARLRSCEEAFFNVTCPSNLEAGTVEEHMAGSTAND